MPPTTSSASSRVSTASPASRDRRSAREKLGIYEPSEIITGIDFASHPESLGWAIDALHGVERPVPSAGVGKPSSAY